MRAKTMRTTGLSSAALAVAVLVAPASADALDAWRDRRGPFFGASFGGGGGTSSTDANLRGNREGIGLFVQARAGGGLGRRLTLDAHVSHFSHGSKENQFEKLNAHTFLGVAANAFVTEHAFARGGMGIAHGALEDVATISGGASVRNTTSANSLGFLAGGGIEFFLNANLAASFTLQGQWHMFSDVSFSGVVGHAGLTWY